MPGRRGHVLAWQILARGPRRVHERHEPRVRRPTRCALAKVAGEHHAAVVAFDDGPQPLVKSRLARRRWCAHAELPRPVALAIADGVLEPVAAAVLADHGQLFLQHATAAPALVAHPLADTPRRRRGVRHGRGEASRRPLLPALVSIAFHPLLVERVRARRGRRCSASDERRDGRDPDRAHEPRLRPPRRSVQARSCAGASSCARDHVAGHRRASRLSIRCALSRRSRFHVLRFFRSRCPRGQ